MNKARSEINTLRAKILPLQQRIDEIEWEEISKVQIPRIEKMVGFCLRSTYDKNNYAKIIDLVKSKGDGLYFIFEECYITKEGNPYLHLDYVSPYLNKEWWDAEVPISGWEKCSENEYQTFKAGIIKELATQKSLREFVKKLKY